MKPADKRVIEFIDAIGTKLGPTPNAVPKGAGAMEDIIKRYAAEVMFKRLSPADAAKKASGEMAGALDK